MAQHVTQFPGVLKALGYPLCRGYKYEKRPGDGIPSTGLPSCKLVMFFRDFILLRSSKEVKAGWTPLEIF
jgi:hypothetical protein